MPYKDRKAVCADLKKIYGAVNLDDAEYAKEEFRENWDKKYPNILKSWEQNWAELTAFFDYPAEIRKIIYTTNAVESYHRMVRKFTKSKAIFPTDDSIRKVIFMSAMEISKKWTMPVRDWDMAYSQFVIYFEDRFVATAHGALPPNPEVYPLWEYPVNRKTATLAAALHRFNHNLRRVAHQRCPVWLQI